jgi:FHS family glucose/mannose:H+ symporter-like MFS transporter
MAEKDRFIDYLAEAPNFLTIFIFSIFFNITSPILIEISKSTGITAANLSLVFTFFTVGAVVGQMTSVFFNRRFKKIYIVLAGFIIEIPLTIILSFNSNLAFFYVLYVISGYILGVIWLQANQYVLESNVKNKERMITILVTFYPVGAFIAPFISSSIIKAGLSWRFIYYIIIFLISINIILYAVVKGRKKESAFVQKEARLSVKEIFTDKSKNLIFIVIFLAISFYCCSETIVATWAPTFFRDARNLGVQSASIALNLFWLFIIIGRIISMVISGRVKATTVMMFISILAIASMSIVVFLYNEFLIFFLISLAGLGYSALFPLLYAKGTMLYDKGRGMIVTFLFISVNLGTSAGPFITKFISKTNLTASISFSFILMAIVTIMIILVTYLFNKKINNSSIIKES